jgi:hypothetical protein
VVKAAVFTVAVGTALSIPFAPYVAKLVRRVPSFTVMDGEIMPFVTVGAVTNAFTN